MFPRDIRNNRGITIVEMMIVLAIVAVLAAIALPDLRAFVINNRLDSASNDFQAALNLARSEAIRRGGNVVVNRAAGSAAQQWTLGWAMFIDANGNNALDAGEEVIRVGQPLSAPPPSDTMKMYASRNTPNEITFTPSGRLAAGLNVRVFVFCHKDPDGKYRTSDRMSRAVIITETGRIQLAATNADGEPMKDSGGGQARVTNCDSP